MEGELSCLGSRWRICEGRVRVRVRGLRLGMIERIVEVVRVREGEAECAIGAIATATSVASLDVKIFLSCLVWLVVCDVWFRCVVRSGVCCCDGIVCRDQLFPTSPNSRVQALRLDDVGMSRCARRVRSPHLTYIQSRNR